MGQHCGTLSHAIKEAAKVTGSTPVTVTFLVTSVTINGILPVISNTNGVKIMLDGTCTEEAGRGRPGVRLQAGDDSPPKALTLKNNVTVKGLKITGFSTYAIDVQGDNNQISCNWLGTDNGTSVSPGSTGGIRLGTEGGTDANNNKLGEAGQPLSGNLIGGSGTINIVINRGTNNYAYYTLVGVQGSGAKLAGNTNQALRVRAGGQLKLASGNRMQD